MKKVYLLFILVLLHAQMCLAQRFCPAVKFEVAPSLNDPGANSGFKFMGDFKITPNLLIGLGLGEGALGMSESNYVDAEKEMVATYEVFADFKWLPNSNRKVSFLLTGEFGRVWGGDFDYSFLQDDWDGNVIGRLGNTVAIGPGIDIALKRGSLQITAECRWQQSTVWDSYHDNQHKRSLSFFGLGIAYQWGNRKPLY